MKVSSATPKSRFVRFTGILTVIFAAALFVSGLPVFSASAEGGSSFVANFLGIGSDNEGAVSIALAGGPVIRTVCASGCDLTTVAAAVAEVNAAVPPTGVTYNVSAGHVETATAGGFTITATGSLSSPIVFQKNPATMGANPEITASNALTVGSLHDAIFEIIGGDYITISGFTMLENPANTVTAAATNTMTEFGVALFYATVTDGAQNCTIQNNTIDLDRTYQNTFGIYANATHTATVISTSATATGVAGGNSGLKIYTNSITDVNNGIVVVGPTAAADHNEVVDVGGVAAPTGNVLTNYGTTGTFSGYANVSGTVNGILVRNTRNFNISFNSITSSNGGVTAGTINGVQIPAFSNAPTGTFTNNINNNTLSIKSGVIAGIINGLNIGGTSASTTSTLNVNNNDFNNFGHTVAGTAAITFITNGGTHQFINVNNNTFTNLNVNTTGSVTLISNSNTNSSATGIKNVNGNSIVTGFTKTGAGGTLTLFTDNGSDVLGAVNNTNNNNFSNITLGGGAAGLTGISNTNGGSPTKTVSGNTISNVNTGGGTGTVTLYSINFDGGTTTVANNAANTITHGGTINGFLFGSSGAGTTNASQNTVHTLTGSGTGTVTGISVGGGTTTTRNIFRNKVYNLENNNVAGTLNGILVSSGLAINVFNNLVGDLRTPTVNAPNSLNGINVTSATATSSVNLSYNTVYLNAISSGANFGSSALSATVSATATTASLNARNNIFVNLSTPNGTGLTVAYRRSGTALDNYGSASNNNDFYAGMPGAARLIFFDGTNSDQTLAAYKARVAPRDGSSVTENPAFVSTTGSSPNFLHINAATPTQLESGGVPITGITDDFDGDTRNGSTPDIGADEFVGIGIDLSSPIISYATLANTTLTTNRTVNATITDISGVAGGALAPRIYYRKNGGAYISSQCGAPSGNVYPCVIDNSMIGGVVTGDIIDYFVVAQDTLGNVGANPSSGFAATDVNNVTSPPTSPNSYTIVNGAPASINVGTGETITSLTNSGGLFQQLNAGVLTSNVTVNITSDLTTETGLVALNQQVEEGAGAGTYTLTIKPSGGARIVSGTNGTGALIRLNGADRVTIDGSTSGGTDRSLTITNNSTATATAAIHIISLGVGAGATDNTVKNTNLSCGADQSTSTSVTYGISHGGTLLGNGGADNDNNSFINNAITKVNVGIYSSGQNAANQVQNTVISNNLIGPTAFGADQIGRAGIIFNLTNGATVTGNEVRFVGVLEPQTSSGGSYDKLGISHAFNGWSETTSGDLAVSNTLIARNKVHDIVEENTFSAVGIFMAGGNGMATTANQTVNNFVWNVRANGTVGDNGASIGIASGNGDVVAFNSIYAAGDVDPGAATTSSTSSFGIQITSGTVVNLSLRDNVSFVDYTSNTASLKHGSIKIPASFAWGAGGSNYNDLYVLAGNTQAIVGRVGTTDALTLADWQTASGQDANSLSVDPLFVSTSDLHLQAGSTIRALGVPVAGVTTDIDGDNRHPSTPDIGADQFLAFVFPTVQFSSPTYSGAENTNATITVTRAGDLTVASSVNFATSNGTATGGMACGAGVDYVTTSGTLSFAAMDASETFAVQLCSDVVIKGDETINLTLSSPSNATLGSPSTAVLTITNVNPPMPGVLALSSATYSIGEGGANLTITVNRTGGSDGAVSVNYGLTDGTATGGAACGGAIDYNNTGGTVNFTGGQTSQTFNVPVCEDAAVEGNETFTVTLSGATGGATIGSPSSAVVTINDNDAAGPTCESPSIGNIEVNATAGTTGPTGYPTLSDAFAAINANTHQGAITIDVCGNTSETASATLNASGSGGTYTSVSISPVGGQRIIEGSIVGAVVKLNGADNVTIDGRIGGTGTGRDLMIRNNSATTATAAIWLSSTGAGAGATGNTIRNLEISAGQTADTGALATFGIMMSGAAITVTSDGNDNDNNSFIANRITRARYGIVTRGVAANNNEGLVITDNIIGPDMFGPNEIGKAGLFLQGDTGAVVSRNTVQYVGGTFATTTAGADRCGICIGGESWGQTEAGVFQSGDYSVTKNIVHDIIDERTFSAAGIRLGTTRVGMPTNNLVANNFVYNIRANATAGDQAVGIGYAAGHTDRIVFNSIAMTGDMDPAGTTNGSIYGNAMRVSTVNGTNNANLTMQNNSIFMDVNSNTATVHFYAITLPVATYSFGTGGLNYNNYYVNQANPQMRTGGIGTTSGATPGAEFQTLANWQTALTPPQDANSIQADPLYFSNAFDLHIQPASPNINVGTTIAGITDDIDAQVRPNGANPDIGADEFYPAAGSVRLSSSSYSVSETGGTVTVTVLRLGGANGAASVDYATGGGTATGGASCTAGVDYVSASGTLNWADLDATPKTVMIQICADGVVEGIENFNVTLSNPTTVTLGSPSSAVVNILDAGSTVTGTINVGSGEAITSLTNPGGIFDVINNGTVTGNTTINITSDLAGETGAIQLNEFASPFTITIKPVGAARTVSGTSSATTGLVGFNAADRVTIDGSLSGGSDRSLTVQSNNTATTGGGIYFASVGTNGATDNTIKNVNVWGGGATTGTLLGITFASNSFGALGSNHDNNRIENNDIRGTFYGIAVLGESAANQNTGTVITKNVMPATGTGGIGRIGVYLFNDDGAQITENTIASVSSATAVDCIGLAIGNQNITLNPAVGEITNATIARNSIGVVSNTVTNSSVGIVLASGATGTNNVVNNMVTGVIGNADVVSAATNDVVAGILIIPRAGATQNVYHNSVSMTGNRGTTNNQAPSFALAITADQPTNVVNNILVNSQTRGGTGGGGESYAIGFDGPAANANLTSNFNDLFVSGAQGQVGITGDLTTAAQTPTAGTGTNQTTLAAWQAATTEDANSFSVDPLFVSTTDLHLQAMSPMINAGTNVGVTNDFDGQTRVPPVDIGADEIPAGPSPGVLAFSSATYNVSEAGPTVTLTVNRTGGSTGAVTVNYTLGGGTATGGPTCGGTVDYDNDGGTVMFADGETSKTFNVPICEDVAVEGNETFNATLSGATGGATIGMPNPATVTIIDNDTAPAMFNVAISDARVTEGNTGTVNMTFNVTLTAVMPPLTEGGAVASVQYATANGTATAGSDYGATMGTLNFNTTGTQTVTVVVSGDTTKESNEFLFVNLSNPSANTTITDSQGAGIIVDEDRPYVADFDRDIKSDFSVFRPSTAVWYVLQSSNSTPKIGSAGPSGDVAVPGDYDADGKADFAVFQNSSGNWSVLRSSDSVITTTNWGITGDKPVQGDYDGDGKTDFAVFRPSSGQWWILRSATSTSITVTFGISTDKLVQGEYDGDFKTDIAVYRNGTWFVLRSSDGSVSINNWGNASDRPVSGDFDGDGRNDLAVYRSGVWWILNSLSGTFNIVPFGLGSDVPAAADYDGDGTTDRAVFRGSTGDWYVLRSSDSTLTGVVWGVSTDVPVPTAYIPQ